MAFECIKAGWNRFRCCRRGDCEEGTVEILTASGMDMEVTKIPNDESVPQITQKLGFVVYKSSPPPS